MLNKQICIRCINSYESEDEAIRVWDHKDDRMWQIGNLYCPAGEWYIQRKEDAYHVCPKKFEHAIASAMKK